MSIPRSSDPWVVRLIVKMWEMVFVIWQYRKSCLHDTPFTYLMGGSYALEKVLRMEWDLGFDNFSRNFKNNRPRKKYKSYGRKYPREKRVVFVSKKGKGIVA